MTPAWYDEYTIASSNGRQGVGESILVPVMTRLFSALHATKRTHELQFAIAFPGMKEGDVAYPAMLGNMIRVWTGDERTLLQLRDKMMLPDAIRRSVVFRGVTRFEPSENDSHGLLRAYVRYRIPSRKSRVDGCRNRRLERSRNLPYLRVSSRSNRQAFSISILPVDVYENSEVSTLDSYGLSRIANPTGLPIVNPCA